MSTIRAESGALKKIKFEQPSSQWIPEPPGLQTGVVAIRHLKASSGVKPYDWGASEALKWLTTAAAVGAGTTGYDLNIDSWTRFYEYEVQAAAEGSGGHFP